MIGGDISAVANDATLDEKSCAYFIWGIKDRTHEIAGTNHNLQNLKKEMKNWRTGSVDCCQKMLTSNIMR